MAFVKIENGIVVQKQPNAQDGFIAAPDMVVCGQIRQEDGSFTDPPPPDETVKRQYEVAVQGKMDDAAKLAGYDDIKTAVTYADEPAVEKFQLDGQAFRAWRSLCWAHCYQALSDFEQGLRAQPTVQELLDELPALTLPT